AQLQAVASRAPGRDRADAGHRHRHAAQPLADVVFAVAVDVVVDHAGQVRAAVPGRGGVDGEVVAVRPAGVLHDADADGLLTLEDGVDGQQVAAVAQVGDAGVHDQAAQGVRGGGVAGGDALAPAVPGEAGVAHARAGVHALGRQVVEVAADG